MKSKWICGSRFSLNHPFKSTINQNTDAANIEEWARKGQKHSKTVLGPISSKTHNQHIQDLKKIRNNRNNYRTAIQLITGHIGLNYQLNKMGLSTTNLCPSCEDEVETVTHFLGQCPAHSLLRYQLLNTYHDNITNIFANNSLHNIIKYANKTGRLDRETLPHTSGVT